MEIAHTKLKKSSLNKSKKYLEAKPQLSFYELPPTESISLQEFEEFAVERLKVLKIMETVGIQHVKTNEEYDRELRNKLKATKIWKEMKTSGDFDRISHYILRLAYCRSDELRRWFLQQELDLFRYRFSILNHDEKKNFAAENDLGYTKIDDNERDEIANKLSKCGKGAMESEYYKVFFTEVLDLVRTRKVYLQNGYAYVKFSDLISIISNHFREHLSKELARTCRSLPRLEEDNRLLPLLNNLSRAYLGEDFSAKSNSGAVTIDMIESLSRKSFPPCMQQLHQNLRQNHHLRHGGRLQYGLFLKGIGLSLEDAMRFWKLEFTKIMESDKFEKSYAYNIRYNYGKEGKRANYTPYSCAKIIMSNPPSQGDYHGCVFRHVDPDLLKQRYRNQGIPAESIEMIMNYVEQKHYTLACTHYFEATHNLKNSNFGLQHPNQYFDESQKVLNGEVKPQVSSTPVRVVKLSKVNSSQSSSSQLSNSFSKDDFMDDTDMGNLLDEEMEE